MNAFRGPLRYALAAMAAAGVIVAAEAALRKTPFAEVLPRTFTSVPGLYTHDAEIGDMLAANYPKTPYAVDGVGYDMWTNEIGCYDAPIAGRHPMVYVTGDSQTWTYAPFADTWTKQAQDYLGVDIAKCGVPGFGTRQELLKTKRDIARIGTPRVLMVGYYSDDVADDAAQARGTSNGFCRTRAAGARMLDAMKCWLYRHSILYDLTVFRVLPRILPAEALRSMNWALVPVLIQGTLTQTDVDANHAHLLAFQAFAKDIGARLLVVRIPTDQAEVERKAESYAGWEGKRRASLEQFVRENDIEYFDLLPYFSTISTSTPLYWEVNRHMNLEGNHLAGALVARYLVEHGLVHVSDKAAVLAALKGRLLELGLPASAL